VHYLKSLLSAELPLCRDRYPELIAHHGQGDCTACHLDATPCGMQGYAVGR
jgi:hypothetical protein